MLAFTYAFGPGNYYTALSYNVIHDILFCLHLRK